MRAVRFLGTIVVVMGFILSGMGESLAAEEKFPTKPIQVIIGFVPGSTNVLLRTFSDKLPEYLGQPMTFTHKPGAAGSLGAAYVADAKPDGYTLLASSPSSVVVVPLANKGLSYTWESFVPIVAYTSTPYALSVRSDARWKNLQELVEEARKNPGKISYATSGAFSMLHITTEAFSKEAGIKMNHIPNLGGLSHVSAVLGGHVDVLSAAADGPYPHVKAGTMRVLTVFTKKRVEVFPDAPTASEAGYPVVIANTHGLLAPKGTPKEFVQKIYLAMRKVLENHEASVKEQLFNVCSEVDFRSPEEYAALLRDANNFHSDMIKRLREGN